MYNIVHNNYLILYNVNNIVHNILKYCTYCNIDVQGVQSFCTILDIDLQPLLPLARCLPAAPASGGKLIPLLVLTIQTAWVDWQIIKINYGMAIGHWYNRHCTKQTWNVCLMSLLLCTDQHYFNIVDGFTICSILMVRQAIRLGFLFSWSEAVHGFEKNVVLLVMSVLMYRDRLIRSVSPMFYSCSPLLDVQSSSKSRLPNGANILPLAHWHVGWGRCFTAFFFLFSNLSDLLGLKQHPLKRFKFHFKFCCCQQP